MILLSVNNATTTLGGGISSSATTVVLATGAGAMFPSPGASEYFTLTLNDALTGLVYEVCWCTARTGDSLTVLRGQEGTTARAWLIGDYAYNTQTANSIATARMLSSGNIPTLPFTIPPAHWGVTQFCNAASTITLPAVAGIQDGFPVAIVCIAASIAVTINTNSANVLLPSGSVNGSFPLTGLGNSIILQWNAAFVSWITVSSFAQVPYVNAAVAVETARAEVAEALLTPLADFGVSLSSTGSQTLPSGLIIKWGANTVGLPTAVTFPVAFPHACFQVIVSEENANAGTWGVGAPTVHGSQNPTTTGYTGWSLSWNGSAWVGSTDSQTYIAIGW